MMKEKAFYCKCRNRSYDLHETVVFGSYTSSMKNDQLETKSFKKIDVTIF